MPILLDNSTSTSATSGDLLAPGLWMFTLDATNANASITIDRKSPSGTEWMPVTKSGAAVALTITAPDQMVYSSGETYRVTNADGTPAVTVRADKVPNVLSTT